MKIFNIFLGKNKIVPIRQSEQNECGLSCIAMIFGYFNHYISLDSIREITGPYTYGMSILNVIDTFEKLKMKAKAIKFNKENFSKLSLPCIIHWDNSHYVILERISKKKIYIIDPIIGRRIIEKEEFFDSTSFIAILISNYQKVTIDIENDFIKKKAERFKIFDVEKNILLVVFLLFIILELLNSILPIAFAKTSMDINMAESDLNYLFSSPFLSVISLFFLQIIISHYSKKTILIYEKQLQLNWSEKFISKLLTRKISFFENRGSGNIITRLQSIEVVKNFLRSSFLIIIIKGITSLFIILFIFYINIYISFSTFFSIVLMFLVRYYFSEKIISLENDFVIHQSKHMSSIIESIRSISAIFVNNCSQDRIINWAFHFSNHMNSSIKLDKIINKENFFLSFINFSNRVFVIVYSLHLFKSKTMSLDDFAIIILYREALFYRILDTITQSLIFLRINGHLERIEEVINYPEVIYSKNKIEEKSVGLSIKDLSYKYPGSKDFIFKNVFLRVEPGQSIAITGRSGIGKTTFFKTILGFYDDYEGEFFLVNEYGKETKVSSHTIREISGIVQQDDHLFTGSIYQNVSLFSENIDFDKVRRCLEIACVKSEVESMKLSYNTIITEGAKNISIGQKQRILLARALYKDPLIIFLDESTSNLDINLERKISLKLRNLKITKIFIAHRPETIQSADIVLTLENSNLKTTNHKVNSNE